MVQWADQPEDFAKTCQDYITAMLGCGHMVMRVMALSLGLPEDYFADKLTNDSYWIMRMIGYPPLKSMCSAACVACGRNMLRSRGDDYYCLAFECRIVKFCYAILSLHKLCVVSLR